LADIAEPAGAEGCTTTLGKDGGVEQLAIRLFGRLDVVYGGSRRPFTPPARARPLLGYLVLRSWAAAQIYRRCAEEKKAAAALEAAVTALATMEANIRASEDGTHLQL
jgi:hypothetical protein